MGSLPRRSVRLSLSFIIILISICSSDAVQDVKNPASSEIRIRGEASEYLESISISNPDGSDLSDDTVVKYETNNLIVLDFDLIESMEKLVSLRPQRNSSHVFRAEQQYETSLTLMDEGPHLDLLNWKHYSSEWKELEEAAVNSFLTEEIASSQFPVVSTEEIVEAVREDSRRQAEEGYDPGDRWIGIAKRCESHTDYPCGVSVSKVRLRISVDDGARWKGIMYIEFQIPMGC